MSRGDGYHVEDSGVSPIVATIILIIATLFVGGMAFVAFRSQSTSMSKNADIKVQSADLITTSSSSVFSVAVKNSGTVPMDRIEVSLSDLSLLSSDHFSIRWKGYLNAPSDGQYVFSLNSDDGSVLFLDGKKVLGKWQKKPFSGEEPRHLTKGRHAIEVRYREWEGFAHIWLKWKKPGDKEFEIIDSEYFIDLKAEYFRGDNLDEKVFENAATRINHDWGDGSPTEVVSFRISSGSSKPGKTVSDFVKFPTDAASAGEKKMVVITGFRKDEMVLKKTIAVTVHR